MLGIMKKSTRSLLKIFAISLAIFLPLEFVYYYIQDVYGFEFSYLISFLEQDILFSLLATIIFVVCFNFYKILKTKEEISMVGFFLKPEEMTEDSKLLYYASLLGFIGWTIYSISLNLYFDIIPNSISKRTIEIVGDSFLFVSIFFVIAILFTFNGWLKRLRKYV
jgi:hypothetical protein